GGDHGEPIRSFRSAALAHCPNSSDRAYSARHPADIPRHTPGSSNKTGTAVPRQTTTHTLGCSDADNRRSSLALRSDPGPLRLRCTLQTATASALALTPTSPSTPVPPCPGYLAVCPRPRSRTR